MSESETRSLKIICCLFKTAMSFNFFTLQRQPTECAQTAQIQQPRATETTLASPAECNGPNHRQTIPVPRVFAAIATPACPPFVTTVVV